MPSRRFASGHAKDIPKPRRSRRDYVSDSRSSSSHYMPQQLYPPPPHMVSNVPIDTRVPQPQHVVLNVASPLPVSSNSVTMTLQEYHALMRQTRPDCSRCIYYPDSCRRFQPINVWCASCISQHMFPDINRPCATNMFSPVAAACQTVASPCAVYPGMVVPCAAAPVPPLACQLAASQVPVCRIPAPQPTPYASEDTCPNFT